MGKFSDYVGTIKNQTDNLREVVTAKSGVDCSKKSISECTGVVDGMSVDGVDYGYIRPSWHPDIEDIVMKAPNIVKDGVTYYPIVASSMLDTEVVSSFYKQKSTSSSNPAYYRGTGCDAYVFSDDIDNDVNNITADVLQVGDTITHVWDTSKDIGSGANTYKLRWCVFYVKDLSVQALFECQNIPNVEIVVRQGVVGAFGGVTSASSAPRNYWTKYIKICKDVKPYYRYALCAWMTALEELVIDCDMGGVYDNSSLSYCTNLKRLTINGQLQLSASSFDGSSSFSSGLRELVIGGNLLFSGLYSSRYFSSLERMINYSEEFNTNFDNCPKLKTVELLNTKSITASNFFTNAYNLQYIKIPSTLQAWTGTSKTYTLPYCKYVELFNDFDISGVVLEGAVVKSIQWLKDLCIWLKDRTGDTANTMIIGTKNLDNANNIYLTFNPSDKRDIVFDGVTAETEGAVSITDFITNQLNWTLS